MLGRVLKISEIKSIITEDIFYRFKAALWESDTEVLHFKEGGYVYRNNGQGVIIRKVDDYISNICIHKDAFNQSYSEFLVKCVNK